MSTANDRQPITDFNFGPYFFSYEFDYTIDFERNEESRLGIAWLLPFFRPYAGLIAPDIAYPFGVFLMRQFMHTVPHELFDAAKVDGASELQVFLRIVVPLTRPVSSTSKPATSISRKCKTVLHRT